jgi:phosphoglycerate dehydrogenase-like enzyme
MPDLSIGVIGYGRIGSALSELLMFLGSRVRIFSGSEKKIVALAAAGAEVSSIDDSDFSDLDILINTAPRRILSPDKEVELLRSGVRIIELASGKNFSSDDVNIMASIPDKMYPVSSGRMYAKYILRALSSQA